MAKVRMINTRFWNDSFVSKLDPIEKLLFLYFISNEHTNICGVYELPLKIAAIETGIDESMFRKVMRRLGPKILYRKGWVIVTNFPRYQSLNLPKVKQGFDDAVMAIPKDILEIANANGFSAHWQSIGNALATGNSDIDSDSDSDTESAVASATKVSFDPIDLELATDLAGRIKSNTPTFKDPNLESWAAHIRLMRERDNRTPEQIRYVIDWCQKDVFWQGNILSTKKLREKFDTLVAQIKRKVNADGEIKSKVAFA